MGATVGRRLGVVGAILAAGLTLAGEPAKSGVDHVGNGFENGSPLQWEADADGAVHVRLLYDYERQSPNRAAGHWHFQLQGQPGSDVTLVLQNFDNI